MTYLKYSVGFLLCCQLATAQTATDYANTIQAADLEKHLRILAADDMEGRETGKAGQRKAADYIAKQFAAENLQAIVKTDDGKTGYFQPFKLYQKTWGDFYVKAGDKTYTYPKDFIVNGLFAVMQETTVETVFVGYGIVADQYNDYAKLNVQGKAVVILEGEPKKANGNYVISNSTKPSDWSNEESVRKKALIAKDKGAEQVFIVSAESPESYRRLVAQRTALMGRFNRMSLKPSMEKIGAVGTFLITQEMGADLLNTTTAKLQAAVAKINKTGKANPGALKGKISLKAERKDEILESSNVMGFLEGTDKKDEVVVISAHYDHIGIGADGQVNNGANDDGSGTVSVIEIAQAFAKAKAEGHGPRRSILFLAVSGEEKGLLGSEYYADMDPVLPLNKTVSNLNIDMVGRIDDLHEGKSDNYIYVIGSDKLSSELHQISEDANRKYTMMELDYKYNDPNDPQRIYYRSDHYNFAKHKIPIIFYFNGLHADYHRPGDDVEKIDFKLAEKSARLVFYTAWDIVNRENKLVVDSNKP